MQRLACCAVLCLVAVLLSGFAAHGQPDSKAPIRVGILHSLTGTMAISESSLMDVELLAIHEINRAGGVLGRRIEAIVEDAESRFTDIFPEKAKKLVREDKVAALFGCWTSVSRKNVLPVIEANNALLFYPVAYEGNECSRNVVYGGALPNQQVFPAIDWLLSKEGGSRKNLYLAGTDYVYPRTVHLLLEHYLKGKDAKIVGVNFTPFGHRDYQTIVRDIKAKAPDAVLCLINGDSNINFFEELAAQGIRPQTTPVLSFLNGEDELRGLRPAAMKGHLAAWSYFQSLDTPANKTFVKNVKARYGNDRITDDPMAAAYALVYLWKAAVEKAKTPDVNAVRAALRSLEIDTPIGKLAYDAKTQHLHLPLRIGRIRDDRQFDIVYETRPIAPEPYPQVAFPGWTCDWTKGGVTRGKSVDIVPPR
jgi:urea transport system substrate-binding protein